MLSSARGFDTRNLKNVKTAVEHVGLYVGLILYTAIGAMVHNIKYLYCSVVFVEAQLFMAREVLLTYYGPDHQGSSECFLRLFRTREALLAHSILNRVRS